MCSAAVGGGRRLEIGSYACACYCGCVRACARNGNTDYSICAALENQYPPFSKEFLGFDMNQDLKVLLTMN